MKELTATLDSCEEAHFIQAYAPRSVLDAGCGTGRVAIELARRGVEVVGVDIDTEALSGARQAAPHIEWHLCDIASLKLNRTFDAVVAVGNVIIFLSPGSEGAVLKTLARHLAPGGVLITGFALAMGYLELEEYDRLAEEAGLTLQERYSTWDRRPWTWPGHYAVSVHRRTGNAKRDA